MKVIEHERPQAQNMRKNSIISLISFRYNMLCKAVACLLISIFTITSVTYGYDRSDLDTLKRVRNRESVASEAVVNDEFQVPESAVGGTARTSTASADLEGAPIAKLLPLNKHLARFDIPAGEYEALGDNDFEELLSLLNRRAKKTIFPSLDRIPRTRVETLGEYQAQHQAETSMAIHEVVKNASDWSIGRNGDTHRRSSKHGQGAFQIFGELSGQGEYAVLETHRQGYKGLRAVLWDEGNSDYHAGYKFTDGLPTGTKLTVHKTLNDVAQRECARLLYDKLKVHTAGPIFINGKQINTPEEYEYSGPKNGGTVDQNTSRVEVWIKDDGYTVQDFGLGMNLKVFVEDYLVSFRGENGDFHRTRRWSPKEMKRFSKFETSRVTQVEMWINGHQITSYTNAKDGNQRLNLAKELIIEFPYGASSPNSWNRVEMDRRAIRGIRKVISDLTDPKASITNPIAQINSMAILIRELLKENPQAAESLTAYLKERTGLLIEARRNAGETIILVPNEINVENRPYGWGMFDDYRFTPLDPELFDFSLEPLLENGLLREAGSAFCDSIVDNSPGLRDVPIYVTDWDLKATAQSAAVWISVNDRPAVLIDHESYEWHHEKSLVWFRALLGHFGDQIGLRSDEFRKPEAEQEEAAPKKSRLRSVFNFMARNRKRIAAGLTGLTVAGALSLGTVEVSRRLMQEPPAVLLEEGELTEFTFWDDSIRLQLDRWEENQQSLIDKIKVPTNIRIIRDENGVETGREKYVEEPREYNAEEMEDVKRHFQELTDQLNKIWAELEEKYKHHKPGLGEKISEEDLEILGEFFRRFDRIRREFDHYWLQEDIEELDEVKCYSELAVLPFALSIQQEFGIIDFNAGETFGAWMYDLTKTQKLLLEKIETGDRELLDELLLMNEYYETNRTKGPSMIYNGLEQIARGEDPDAYGSGALYDYKALPCDKARSLAYRYVYLKRWIEEQLREWFNHLYELKRCSEDASIAEEKLEKLQKCYEGLIRVDRTNIMYESTWQRAEKEWDTKANEYYGHKDSFEEKIDEYANPIMHFLRDLPGGRLFFLFWPIIKIGFFIWVVASACGLFLAWLSHSQSTSKFGSKSPFDGGEDEKCGPMKDPLEKEEKKAESQIYGRIENPLPGLFDGFQPLIIGYYPELVSTGKWQRAFNVRKRIKNGASPKRKPTEVAIWGYVKAGDNLTLPNYPYGIISNVRVHFSNADGTLLEQVTDYTIQGEGFVPGFTQNYYITYEIHHYERKDIEIDLPELPLSEAEATDLATFFGDELAELKDRHGGNESSRMVAMRDFMRRRAYYAADETKSLERRGDDTWTHSFWKATDDGRRKCPVICNTAALLNALLAGHYGMPCVYVSQIIPDRQGLFRRKTVLTKSKDGHAAVMLKLDSKEKGDGYWRYEESVAHIGPRPIRLELPREITIGVHINFERVKAELIHLAKGIYWAMKYVNIGTAALAVACGVFLPDSELTFVVIKTFFVVTASLIVITLISAVREARQAKFSIFRNTLYHFHFWRLAWAAVIIPEWIVYLRNRHLNARIKKVLGLPASTKNDVMLPLDLARVRKHNIRRFLHDPKDGARKPRLHFAYLGQRGFLKTIRKWAPIFAQIGDPDHAVPIEHNVFIDSIYEYGSRSGKWSVDDKMNLIPADEPLGTRWSPLYTFIVSPGETGFLRDETIEAGERLLERSMENNTLDDAIDIIRVANSIFYVAEAGLNDVIDVEEAVLRLFELALENLDIACKVGDYLTRPIRSHGGKDLSRLGLLYGLAIKAPGTEEFFMEPEGIWIEWILMGNDMPFEEMNRVGGLEQTGSLVTDEIRDRFPDGMSLGWVIDAAQWHEMHPQATGGVGIPRIREGILEVSEGMDSPMAETDMLGTISAQDKTRMMMIRELIQNARTAIRNCLEDPLRKVIEAVIKVRSYLYRRGGDIFWVLSVADPAGMSRKRLFEKYFPPKATTNSVEAMITEILGEDITAEEKRDKIVETLIAEEHRQDRDMRQRILHLAGLKQDPKDATTMMLKEYSGRFKGSLATGFFGVGNYTVYADSDEIIVRSGLNGEADEIWLRVDRNDPEDDNKVTGIVLLSWNSYADPEGKYEGTIVQRLKRVNDLNETNRENRWVKYLFSLYVGAVSDVRIEFVDGEDEPLNVPVHDNLTLLGKSGNAEVRESGMGIMRYAADELLVQATHDPALSEYSPEWMIRWCDQNSAGVYFGRTPRVDTVESRTAFLKPHLHKEDAAVARARAIIGAYRAGRVEMPGLPSYVDFMKDPHIFTASRFIDPEIRAHAEAINRGQSLPQETWTAYRDNADRLAILLIHINIPAAGDLEQSLFEEKRLLFLHDAPEWIQAALFNDGAFKDAFLERDFTDIPHPLEKPSDFSGWIAQRLYEAALSLYKEGDMSIPGIPIGFYEYLESSDSTALIAAEAHFLLDLPFENGRSLSDMREEWLRLQAEADAQTAETPEELIASSAILRRPARIDPSNFAVVGVFDTFIDDVLSILNTNLTDDQKRSLFRRTSLKLPLSRGGMDMFSMFVGFREGVSGEEAVFEQLAQRIAPDRPNAQATISNAFLIGTKTAASLRAGGNAEAIDASLSALEQKIQQGEGADYYEKNLSLLQPAAARTSTATPWRGLIVGGLKSHEPIGPSTGVSIAALKQMEHLIPQDSSINLQDTTRGKDIILLGGSLDEINFIINKYPLAGKIHVVNIDTKLVDETARIVFRNFGEEADKKFAFYNRLITDLNDVIPDSSISLAVCLGVLEFSDKAYSLDAIAEMERMLLPDGIGYANHPDKMEEIIKLLPASIKVLNQIGTDNVAAFQKITPTRAEPSSPDSLPAPSMPAAARTSTAHTNATDPSDEEARALLKIWNDASKMPDLADAVRSIENAAPGAIKRCISRLKNGLERGICFHGTKLNVIKGFPMTGGRIISAQEAMDSDIPILCGESALGTGLSRGRNVSATTLFWIALDYSAKKVNFDIDRAKEKLAWHKEIWEKLKVEKGARDQMTMREKRAIRQLTHFIKTVGAMSAKEIRQLEADDVPLMIGLSQSAVKNYKHTLDGQDELWVTPHLDPGDITDIYVSRRKDIRRVKAALTKSGITHIQVRVIHDGVVEALVYEHMNRELGIKAATHESKQEAINVSDNINNSDLIAVLKGIAQTGEADITTALSAARERTVVSGTARTSSTEPGGEPWGFVLEPSVIEELKKYGIEVPPIGGRINIAHVEHIRTNFVTGEMQKTIEYVEVTTLGYEVEYTDYGPILIIYAKNAPNPCGMGFSSLYAEDRQVVCLVDAAEREADENVIPVLDGKDPSAWHEDEKDVNAEFWHEIERQFTKKDFSGKNRDEIVRAIVLSAKEHELDHAIRGLADVDSFTEYPAILREIVRGQTPFWSLYDLLCFNNKPGSAIFVEEFAKLSEYNPKPGQETDRDWIENSGILEISYSDLTPVCLNTYQRLKKMPMPNAPSARTATTAARTSTARTSTAKKEDGLEEKKIVLSQHPHEQVRRAGGSEDAILRPFKLEEEYKAFLRDAAVIMPGDRALVLPAYTYLPFLIKSLGADMVCGVDIDPVTIAWLKAVALYYNHNSIGERFLALTAISDISGLIMDIQDAMFREDVKPVPINGVQLEQKDALEAVRSYTENSFDIVFIPPLIGVENGINNTADIKDLVENIIRICAPGGRLIITPHITPYVKEPLLRDSPLLREILSWDGAYAAGNVNMDLGFYETRIYLCKLLEWYEETGLLTPFNGIKGHMIGDAPAAATSIFHITKAEAIVTFPTSDSDGPDVNTLPTRERPHGRTSTTNDEMIAEDIDKLLELLDGDIIDPVVSGEIELHIQIDNNRMPVEQAKRDALKEAIADWLALINSRTEVQITGKFVPNKSEDNGLVKITAKRKGIPGPEGDIGSCSVDAKASINNMPRLIGFLSIAFAGSLIPDVPDNIEDEEYNLADYNPLFHFIDDYHMLLTGESYFTDLSAILLEGSLEKIRDLINEKIRHILINLPPAQKIEYDIRLLKDLLRAV